MLVCLTAVAIRPIVAAQDYRSIYRRLFDRLTDDAVWKGRATAAERQAAVAIVAAGKADAPEYWRRSR